MSRYSLDATHLPIRVIVALLSVALFGGMLPAGAPATLSASAQFKLDAPEKVKLGQPIEIGLSVAGASNVGGYEALLRFDRGAAEFGGVRHSGNDVEAAGRGIAALGPVEMDQGASFGFYSCPVADCARTSGSRAGQGPSGRVQLGTATLIARQPGLLEVALGPARLVDTAGRLIDVGQTPSVVINVGDVATADGFGAPAVPDGFGRPRANDTHPGGTPADVTGDGRVDNGDAREAALDWSLAQRQPDGCATGVGDIDGDGCVNIEDIQAVAAAYSLTALAPQQALPDAGTLAASPADFVASATWTVNTVADDPDAVPSNGVCATAAGQCSLRAAIQSANLHSGNDLITFNIAGSGVHMIQLNDRLPTINDGSGGVMIDGYTQPGASPNTSALASNAAIRIEIRGVGDDVQVPAIFVTSHGNIVQGLAIYNAWMKVWLDGPGAYNNLVSGNFIGTNAAGSFESPTWVDSAGGGVMIDSGAHDNQVGDRTLAGRNVISGNQRSGMQITQEGTSFNVVVNNIIGLTPDGTASLRNLGHGIDHDLGSRDSTIGGTGALERNVVSGNDLVGIEFAHQPDTDRNKVIGNFIGTDLTGTAGPGYAGNGEWGINIEDGPSAAVITDNVIGNNGDDGIRVAGHDTFDTIIARNRIGVSLNGAAIANDGDGILIQMRVANSTIGPDNIIANNQVGVRLDVESENIRNRITHNSIYDNGFGIDLHPFGVSPNGQFATSGPNLRLPFPALSSASPSTVTGRACAGCTVEIFLADGADNEYGQGRTFVGSAVATPDLTGATVGSFSASVSGLAVGDFVTATATDTNGNTSEFALDRLVTASGLTAPGAFVARDSFERTHSASWGTALRGGPWTLPFTPLSDYNMAGGQATINLQAAGTTRMSILASVSERDIDASVQVSTNKAAVGGNQFAYLILRRKDNGNQYQARIRFATNGAVFVQAGRILNGSEQLFGTEAQVAGLTHSANQRIWLRAQAVGASPTTLRIKAWADGSLEPSAWNYTTTNSEAVLQSAGAVGLRAFLATQVSNAPVTISFDGFRAIAPVPADTIAPAAPTGLIAAPGNNAVYLGWNANSEPDLIGYHVYRSTSSPVSTAGSPLSGSEPVTSTNYVDATAVNGTTYFYVITAVDASTNRSGASNQASATPDAAAGSALDFDGVDDYVTFGPAPDVGVSNFTIEAWFRRDGPGVATATSGGAGGVTAVPILTKGRSEADGSNVDMNYFLGIRSSDGVLAADFEDSATGANHAVAGHTPITNGVWHHAAATFDGSTWRLYLDGVLDATLNIGNFTPRSDSIQHAALATSINSTGQVAGFFDGRIDEARVWNVARSQGQIATARDLQVTSGTGLVARWGLNEGIGSSIANSVAGGSNGTAVGGPLWVPGAPFAAGTDPAPSAPTGLDATPGAGRIDLDWNANSESDIAGYNIYRDSVVGGGSTVQVMAAGDIASCSSTGDEATAALLGSRPGDVLALGDNVYEDGTLAEFNNCYNPSWGQVKARTHPAAGNHEYQTANASGYFSYFGSAAGDPALGYYSYDYGTWHIVVLNSNCDNVSCAAGSAQEQWLRADLAASAAQCTLAMWHHPRFSSGDSHGNNPSTAPLFQALYDMNAEIVLSGHDHIYERFAPQTPGAIADPLRGVRQFVAGTGGRSHNGFNTPEPNSQVRNGDTYGVLGLTLKPGGYDWQFVPEAGRTFTDNGSDVCHDANGPVSGSGNPINTSLVTGTSYTDTPVTAGVAYNYTVTAVDNAGHESGPSNQASATADPPASGATALDFDGVDDHVALGPASGLNSNTFTIETWFRRDGTGVMAATTSGAGGVSAAPLMAKGLSGGGTINWFMGVTAGGLLAADFESATDDSNHGITGTTTITNGTWYHAAATYDGTTFRLYLNGTLEGSTAVADGPGTASNHPPSLATAMTPTGVATGFFNGVLDEARVWNVARTTAQIGNSMNQELTSGTGLIGRWGMNEGTGSTVSNSVAGGPAGTAVGGPLWVPGAPFGGGSNQPPAAPTGLSAVPGNNSVFLNWNANSEPDLAGYNVYRDGGPSGPTVQAVGAGDIASCSSTGDEATAALLNGIPGDVLALGDTVYENGTPTEYANCYQPSWGQYKSRTHPVVGNHEYGTANASGYFGYFGAVAGTPGQGYYSYDYGEWHIVVLNSMCANVGGCGPGSPQYNWLVADLAANDEQCTMALWHHPRFSSGSEHGSDTVTQPLYQALYDANADLILTGHDHSYERFAPQTATGVADPVRGIRQFVVGTGGRSHYPLGTLKPNSQVFNGDTYGVIKLQLKPTGYSWEFVPEAGRTFTDSGSDVCHDANGPLAAGTPLNGTTPITGTSFVDTTAVNGTTYSYTVSAVDTGDLESAASSPASATPSASTGSALDFDGTDDYVTFGNAPSLAVTNFTLETWFRRDGVGVTTQTSGGTGGVTSVVPLVTKGASESDTPANVNMNYFLGFRTTDNVLVADFEDTVNGGNHAVTGVTPITSGVWHHAAVTYNTTTDTWNLYLDGVLDRTLTIGDFTPEAGSIQHAGLATALNSTGVPSGRFDGVLDEVRIWNVARTGAQIAAAKDQQLTSGAGLIARWGLDEGNGTTVANSIAGGANGTAVNGPLWVAGAPFGGASDPPPSAPSGLAATPAPGQVSLSWTANSEPDLAGYNVYRATSEPVPTTNPLNGTTVLSAPSYTDTSVVNGTQYFYVVTAVDQTGHESLPSATINATPGASAGHALDFDGVNDYVTFGAASGLNTNQFTVEAWFKQDGVGVPVATSSGAGGVTAVPLVTKGRSGGSTIEWFLGLTADGKIAADFESASDDSNHAIVGSSVVTDGSWHHAAATYDGSNFVVYLDGQFEQSVTVTNGPGTGSLHHAALATAMDTAGAPAGFFNGVIDEARVWNLARTPAQIAAGMSQEISSGSGLIARWGLNEGSGATVANSVSGGPAGTASGGPAWVSGSPFTPPPPPNEPPAVPTPLAPANGSTGIPTSGPTLSVRVSDPEGNAVDTTFYGRVHAPPTAPDFTIVALPDTQHYVDNVANTPNYAAQTQWVVNTRSSLNTLFVTHEGDVVEHADQFEVEWQRADAAMDTLDNNSVPNNLTTGNHDVNTSNGNGSFFDQYFPPSRYLGNSWYGGYLGQLVSDPVNRLNKNNYELFSDGSLDFIILHLELDVPDYSLNWANGILQQYPNRLAIITTHLFVDTTNNRRTTSQFLPNGNSAEAIWQRLIRPNCNVIMVLNGHYPGEGRRTDLNACGKPVHQLLADYQDRANGGDGWLRIMTFKPSENKLYVYTYSPTRNGGAGQYETDADSQFVLDLNLQGGSTFQPIGTVNGTASGGTASVAWPGLTGGTDYEWYAVASDGTSTATGPTWTFTTQADTLAPAAPTGLAATPGTNSVALAWNANTEADLAGYNVFRSTSSPVATTGTPLNGGTLVTAPSYVDNTAVGGTTYFYAVTAVDASDNDSGASNEATATPTAPVGAGVDFDGTNDYVTFGNGAGLNVTNFTIETWFRRDGAGVGTTTGSGGITSAIPLVAKGAQQAETPPNVNMNWFLGIDATSGVLVADFEDNANGTNHPVSGVTAVTSNVWHHAAAAYDATTGTWRLYLDGNLDRTLALSSAFQPENTSVQHGSLATSLNSTGATNGFFNGALDEVRLWNVARSTTQIQAARNLELTSGTGLVARYGLNEGTGTTAASSIAGAPSGTLTNGPAWTTGAPFTVDTTPPAAPAGLTASPGPNMVSLGWNANTEPDLAGYNVYRSNTSPVPTGGQPLNGGTLLTSTSFVDNTVTGGTQYFYAIKAVDASGNPSAASGEASATPTVPSGAAIHFDGTDDHVTFGSAPALGVQNFTIETWFRRDGAGVATSTGTGGLASVIPLVTKGRAEADTPANLNMNYFLGIDASSGVLVADFEEAAGGTQLGLNHPVSGTTAVTSNVWHHAAATYDTATDTWRLYLDGTLDRTLVLTGNPTPESTSIQHAALATAMTSNGTAAGFFNGALDEVRIWSVARSQAQISATKDLELTSGPGLIARYGLIEGAGTTTSSSVSGAPVGTLVNGPFWTAGAPISPPVNHAPVFSTDIGDQSNAEGNVISLDADATDADADTLTYSATGLPAGITVNSTTGVISGTLTSTSAGTYNVVITVSDGGLSDTDPFTWTVANTNQAPVFSTDLLDQNAAEGDTVALDADATDADGDTLTYSATGLPAGVSINPTSGVIGGTLGFGSAGTYNVTVTVSDATLSDTDTFTLTVSATNQDPTFDHDLLDRTDAEGALISLSASATDPDGDTLTYEATGLPAGLSIDSATGLIGGTISLDAAATSPYAVSITVRDGPSVDATDTFSWTVTNTNQAPVFSTDIVNRTDAEGDTPSGLDADASDVDGDTLTYGATGLPAGIAINSSTGVISGTLSFSSAGVHNVVLTVSDGTLTDSDPFTWTVTTSERAMQFNGTSQYVTMGAAPGLDATDFTIETWFRRTGAGTGVTTGAGGITSAVPLVTKGGAESESPATVNMNYFLGIDASTGVLVADFEEAAGGTQLGLNHPVAGTTVVTSNVWHHAAATYDTTTDTWRLYLDGNLDKTLVLTGNPTPESTSTQHAAIGSSLNSSGVPANTGGFFAGVIDEVRIWNVARSTAEIQATENVAITGVRNHLLGRWGFSEGNGSIVGDTASEFDGTAIGGPTWVVGVALAPAGPNVAPEFSTDITDQTANEGALISLDADATDANSDSLTYSATGLPSGLSINANSGIVTGTLATGSAGSHFVTLTVSDGFLTDTDTFTFTVSASDPPPAAPTGLSATRGNGSVSLAWNANTESDLAGYRVFRSTSLPVDTTGNGLGGAPLLTSTTYTDLSAVNGTTYQYAVIAVDTAGGRSPASAAASATPSASAGTALQLNGTSQYVTFGSAPALGAQSFTLETWFRRDGTGTPTSTGTGGLANAAPLITKGRGEAETPANLNMNYFLGIDTVTNTLVADFEDTTNGGNHPVTGVTAIPVSTTTWHHAAVTYDTVTDTWNLYLDGNLERTLGAGGNFTPESTSIQHAGIGTAMTSTGAAAGFFNGRIDEVRIWNVARSQAQIQATRFQELTSGSGLVARYGLNEGSGSTAASSIAGAPNGTAVGTPAWQPGFPLLDQTPPAAPTGLGATPGTNLVALGWSANTEPDLAGYRIFRGTSLPVDTTGNGLGGAALITGTSYTDLTAVNGTAYQYVVVAVDSSANRSPASAAASATPSAAAGSALQFNGTNQYVTFGSAASLGVTTFTLETWFKRTGAGVGVSTGTGGIASAIPLITKGGAEAETPANVNMNYFLGIDATSGKLVADFEEPAGPNHPVSGTAVVTSNVWHHAAATYDATNGTWTLYLDGNLDTTLALGSAFQPQSASIQHAALGTSLTSTGTIAQPPGGFFAGILDEARIWNVARSNAQIAANFNKTLTASAGLIARYGMNDGAGTTTASSVAGAPAGTLTNGPLWTAGPPLTPAGNSAPVFSTDFANRTDAEGDTPTGLDADATDIDGDTLTYSATGLPGGLAINSATGLISGTLSFSSAGVYNTVITVSDGSLTATDTFTWTVTNLNRPPVFSTDFGDRTDAEGDTPTGLDANGTDPDGDTLTYGATGLPSGLSISPTTGLISGTLSSTSSGSYNTVITVSDGSLTATDTFTWTVTNVNRPPVFSTNFGDRTDAEGDTPTGLDANATDPDGDTLTYGATGLPSGLSISPTTGLISGTLSSTSSGSYNTVITVSDGSLTATDTFTWTVTNLNRPPVFSTNFGDRTDAEGDTPTGLDANATDPDGDTLTYGATGLPSGLSISPTTGLISGTLSSTSSGSYNTVITVSDGSLTATDTFTWTVTNVNRPPVFSTDLLDQNAAEGDTINLDANASDPDLDSLTYSATGLPSDLAINSSTGVISGTLGSASAGTYNVTVTVSDGSLTDDDLFTLTVANVNQPPVFSTNFGDRTDAEGAVINFDANATDPDGTTLTYSATGLPGGITINSATGVVSGTLNGTSSGTYNTVITVSDGSLTDTDTFTWTVTNVNQPPTFSTNFGDRTDAEGAVINFDANATDPDGTTLTYSATGLPGGITINSATGVVSGTLNGTSSGTYNTVITVSDGSLTDTDTFTWTVTNVNQPPTFSTNFGDRTDAEGAVINFDANATDPDGTTLTYSATGLPGGITINSATGVVSGTLNGTSSGTYNTVITVSDGSLTDTDTFTWTVTNVNQPPTFSTNFGDRTDAEGAVINFDANATDPDGTTLTYSATGLPGGITINSATGVVSGTLNGTSSGTYNTVITVSDGSLTDTDTFTWTVTDQTLIVYVDDTFTRTVNNGWGSATPTGGAYTIQGTAANYGVGNGVGTMTLPSAGATRSALPASASATDVDVSLRFRADKVAAGGNLFMYAVVRRNGTNEYRVKLRLAANGQVFASASTVVNNVETLIGSEALVPGLTYTANTMIRFRAQVSGSSPTTLRVRAWPDANPEPTIWHYTSTNSNAALQSAGLLGLRAYISSSTTNTPVVMTFDDYRVTSLGGPNQPPTFSTNFGDRTDAEGAVINFDANATDPDGTTLTYSATGLPGGITINSATGVVSGTLNGTSSGTYNTVITVSDGSLTDTDTFTWTVTNVNQPPTFSTNFGDRTDAEGAVINFDANATDPDGTTLTYSATGLPGGITINSATGVVSGTLNGTSSGTYNTVITVSDGSLTDTDTFTWTVTDQTLIVYVDDTFTRTVNNGWGSATPTGGAYTIQGTAANYGVGNGVGTMTLPSAGATRSALPASASATDVDVSLRFRADKVAAGGNLFMYAVVRRNGTNEYRVKLRLAANGQVFASASTVVNNVETLIGSEALVPGLTYTANTMIRFRAQVSGSSPTTLRVRAWPDANPEPTIWHYTSTNSNAALQSAGLLGLRAYISSSTTNTPVVMTFDDYRVTSLGGP